jgi:sugar O-acyltransferase (sialic acid O-acetyltransferase NeuD family)
MKTLVIIGASGFGGEVLWLCRRAGLDVAGFCDDAPDKQSGAFCGLPLLGAIETAQGRLRGKPGFLVAVGSNRSRKALAERALAAGWRPATLIDPAAVCAPDAEIGEGACVGIGSVISCRTRLGRFAIVNHHATVGHDCVVGDFAQICPGARISGGCRLGEGAMIGSNAATLPCLAVGAWSVLGIGTCALRDVPAGQSLVRLPRP